MIAQIEKDQEDIYHLNPFQSGQSWLMTSQILKSFEK